MLRQGRPAPQAKVTARGRITAPRQVERACQLLPRARHLPLPACGHVPMSDALTWSPT
jgi:hypothetical protein